MLKKLQFHFPFKPFKITQNWGNPNPLYDPLGFSKHNGVDANVGRFDWQGRVVSEYPVEGFRVSEVAYYPTGGGNQIGMVSKEKRWVGDKLCYVSILLCHAKQILIKVGDEPSVGELLMIADNTGFSTGVHTHIGIYRLDDNLQKLDTNEMSGSYNPQPLFTGAYAVDVASLGTLIKSNWRYFQYLVGYN